MIAKEKIPNNQSCLSIQPCVGEADSKKLAMISLADSSIEICIGQLTKYIECHVLKDTRITFFVIQGDETKTNKMAQLLVFVRFVGSSLIEEEMLFCRPLETTTEADVFQVVATCFDNSGTKWEKLVGICTDGALPMLGSRSRLFARINQKVL